MIDGGAGPFPNLVDPRPIERCLDIGERQQFTVQIFGKGKRRFGRPPANEQARHMLGTGLRLGNKKPEIQ